MIAKLVFDYDEVDLNLFMKVVTRHNIDLLVANDSVYIYTQHDTLTPFIMIMKEELKIENLFIKEIKTQKEIPSETIIETWYREKKALDDISLINKTRQEELSKMQERIDTAVSLLKQIENTITKKQEGK